MVGVRQGRTRNRHSKQGYPRSASDNSSLTSSRDLLQNARMFAPEFLADDVAMQDADHVSGAQNGFRLARFRRLALLLTGHLRKRNATSIDSILVFVIVYTSQSQDWS